MNWYHMKTVLIYLFLAINLFLLGLLGAEWFSEQQTEKKNVSAAIELLAQNDITVACKVPYKTEKLGALTLQNPKTEAEAFATGILGGRATRMGEAWRREGKEVTFLKRGFTYESGAARGAVEKGSVNLMRTKLIEMGFSMEYARGAAEENAVVFVQEIDGVPLLDFYLHVYPATDGSVAAMEGVWAQITEVAPEKARIRSAADALLSFWREVGAGKTITNIRPGYALLVTENGYRTADAVPVWRVETADGTEYSYDAR